jgi:hypothetical protein
MNAFSVMGPNAASWKPVTGKVASIFGVDDSFGGISTGSDAGNGSSSLPGSGGSMLLNADLAAATNALRNVTITKATLLQSYNTFGVPLGVTISCLPKNEVVDTGDKYTFTTIPNTSVNTPSTLYEAGETHVQAMDWMRTFGKYNAGNIHTQGVLKVRHVYGHPCMPPSNPPPSLSLSTCKVECGPTHTHTKPLLYVTLPRAKRSADQHLHIFQTRSSAYAADSATFLSAPQVPECPWIFVHENHPVINLLRINKHLVGVDVDDQPKMEGQWHKVTQSLFDSSCDTIKTRILSKLETKDLNELSVTNPPIFLGFLQVCVLQCWLLGAACVPVVHPV